MELKPGYKQTDLGVIPREWKVSTIGDLNPFVTSGSRGWAAFYSDRGSPFIRITNLSRDSIYLQLDDLKFVELPSNASEANRTQLREGDLLISITADIGIIGYITASVPRPSYINQHIALVRFDESSVSSRFVSYYLASEKPQKLFRASTDMGAKAGMSLITVKKLCVVLPPFPEQRAIAGALSDVDALLDSLTQTIAKNRNLKQAVMQQFLSGHQRLPGFTDEWEEKAIGEQIDLLTGFPFQSNQYSESGVRLLRGSNVKRGETDWADDLVQWWPKITSDIAKYALHVGDLVIAMDGSLVGRSYARLTLADLPALLLQRVARIRSKTIDIGYLSQFVGSDRFIKYCDSVKTVTAIPHISSADIRNFVIPFPPSLEEQAAIAGVLSDMDAELAALEQRLAKTRALKRGMMQELLTGRTRLV